MLDQPNAPGQTPQPRKLVLPTYPDEQQNINSKLHVQPDQLIHPTAAPPPTNPMAKLQYFWRKDPAYKVLIIASATVIVASIIFTILGSITFLQNSNGTTQDVTIPQNPPTGVPASGTVDLHPTFPTPSGSNGSTTSSQPPAHTTPTLEPGVPTPGQSGSLIVAITNPPVVVANGSKVTVNVATNDIFAEVRLQVDYNAPPFSYASPLYSTDGSGNANITWRVHVHGGGLDPVTATLVAIAIDSSNGQQNSSAPVVIRVDTTGG
jgi:hypothetical protein